MTAKVVITGMGVISPYGVGPAVLWDKLMAGETGLKALTSFDTSHIQCKVGGQFSEFRPESYISPRIIRKVDRFSALGLISAQQALQDAGLLLDDSKPTWSQQEYGGDRVGITVGNNLGGWEFAERELRNLWKSGPREVSPYMATAWFPAAVQGNVSIQFGIKGIGRTFLSDRAGGALALIHAADCLIRGRADIMLAGGAEAPFSPYAALCYETSGFMSTRASDGSTDVYRPFDSAHDGLVAAEGAAFFVLERAEDAMSRGARVYAEIAGWATTHDGYDFVQCALDGQRYAAAMTQAMAQAGVTADMLDCVFAAGSAIPDEDVSETRAIHQALGNVAPRVPVSTPKSAFGNLFGAAMPVDMAIALRSLQEKVIPATLHLDQPASGCDLDYVPRTPRSVNRLDTCLVNARGIGGANAAVLLRH
ncbi:MAG TPA: beta-ketoacyl-[acyl-carrier-protein] synthase family protein [Ktedonobacter sp.]|jgi:3-oxoacyl-(acyl-carrier-protein) synthase|nr:beta-ketoacyl-[acyl-carrier-protein] synthase family protein [Ktedonobacter sp.]HBE26710.1 beta-ketoacyl-[acyl-carrier-protein] synthase family protein [Ktedonobacter sp.]HCF83804.1 beta-ketoacyl-[acyl-carrier-protein] synthase family protein [Ktedonobacter sp.]HCJ33796.1 beta-ketoacyl-[acyl-carrier-protein] synthase family protein [Ktedonobacter sp.]